MKRPVAHSLNSTWFWFELPENCCEPLKFIMKYINIQFCERPGHGRPFHALVHQLLLWRYTCISCIGSPQFISMTLRHYNSCALVSSDLTQWWPICQMHTSVMKALKLFCYKLTVTNKRKARHNWHWYCQANLAHVKPNYCSLFTNFLSDDNLMMKELIPVSVASGAVL